MTFSFSLWLRFYFPLCSLYPFPRSCSHGFVISKECCKPRLKLPPSGGDGASDPLEVSGPGDHVLPDPPTVGPRRVYPDTEVTIPAATWDAVQGRGQTRENKNEKKDKET